MAPVACRFSNPPLPFQNRGGSKCDLFDYKCAAKEKAAAAAE